jgi:hypothetical protein
MLPSMLPDCDVVKLSQYSIQCEFADDTWGNVFEEDSVIFRHHMSSNCANFTALSRH